MSQEVPNPLPGDVIFVVSEGKDALFNIGMQQWIFDKGRKHGPWFSHVAVALDDRLALEASTAPSEDALPTWSGVSLKGGVRLILLPDLLIHATERRVLRSPKATEITKDTLDIKQPYIAGLYGSEFSIKVFKEYAEKVAPLLTGLSDLLGHSQGWTSIPDDVASKVGEDFRTKVLKDSPYYKFAFEARTFYCAELVIAILGIVGLLPERFAKARITPSVLFDELETTGWTDATEKDFSDSAIHGWAESGKVPWQTAYFNGVGCAQFWRNHYAFEEIWKLIEIAFGQAAKRLEGYTDLLNRLRGAPPAG
jgi:hypothetical protein